MIVDSVKNPSHVIGVADGVGGVLHQCTAEESGRVPAAG